MLQVIFLGTAGSLPTPDRNPSGVLVNREGEMMLFDCGEGTQRQMMRARTGMMRLDHIFITHLHADHILGLPGLLETMAFQGRTQCLTVAGPNRTSDMVRHVAALGCCPREFQIETVEMRPGDRIKRDGFYVEALAADHSVPCLGYSICEDQRPGRFNRERAIELGVLPGPLFGRLQRGGVVKIDGREILPQQVMGAPRLGRKIVISGDTRPCPAIEGAAKDADLLIHDASLADDLSQWAFLTKHSTAGEAAQLAHRADVRRLVLTHISSRYSEDASPLLNDARKYFNEVVVAEDLMRLEIALRDS